MRHKSFCVVLLLLCVFAITACEPSMLAVKTTTIERADKTQANFSVEMAVTPAQQEHGLMGRETLAPDHGMLFVFDEEQVLTFWMKNTPLFLDMVFADSQGVIVDIHAKARPFDETRIVSRKPARYVLEIAGGQAERQNIHIGDQIKL